MNAEEISSEGSAKARREPLSRERVIRTALRVMDEDGLEAVTMRRIGRELGVEAMSLYNHVRDKEDILDSISEAVLGEFRVPSAENWTDGLRQAAREYRRLLLAHPNVLTLVTERKRPFTSPESLRAYEFALDLLRTAGLSEADSVKSFHAFGGYILGFVTMERGPIVGVTGDAAHAQGHWEMARMVESADLPRMREALPHFLEIDLDEQFEFGLDLLIEGIRARIAVAS